MKTVIVARQWGGYDANKNFEQRPDRLMTNGKTLLAAVKAGILTLEKVEHYDAGYYCGTWYIFSDSAGKLTTMYNSSGFGFNTWDNFQIERDVKIPLHS